MFVFGFVGDFLQKNMERTKPLYVQQTAGINGVQSQKDDHKVLWASLILKHLCVACFPTLYSDKGFRITLMMAFYQTQAAKYEWGIWLCVCGIPGEGSQWRHQQLVWAVVWTAVHIGLMWHAT